MSPAALTIGIVAADIAKPAGIGVLRHDPRILRQGDPRGSLINREQPVVAGDVPEKLVMRVEIPDLVFHLVFDLVGMTAMLNENVGIPDADTEGISLLLDCIGFPPAVARHPLHGVLVRQLVARLPLVVGIVAWQFAENSTSDAIAF